MISGAVEKIMALYPRIFLACHQRHVHDPQTRRAISAHQASILDHLDEIEATSLNQLARHMGVTLSTMSISIGRLIRDGCVVRRRDPVDNRRIQLRLSAAGARLRDAQTVLDPALIRKLLRNLSHREQAEGIRGLSILARAAQQEMHRRAASRSARKGNRLAPNSAYGGSR
jgi:MarR family transcriptional regulator, organic hydroperoxide resistance regulator